MLRTRIRISESGVSPTQLTSADFTYLGCFRLHNVGQLFTNILGMTGRVVSGDTHLFITQSGAGGLGVQPYAPVEILDPGVYAMDYADAVDATLVHNWGISSGVAYDCFHGKFGLTYNSPLYAPTGPEGDPYYIANAFIAGIGWSEAEQLLYVSYSSPYGNINPEWNLLAMELTTPGAGPPNEVGLATTAYGVWRNQTGTATYGGDLRFGAQRAYYWSDTAPDGKALHGSSNGYTAQGGSNQGPSLWGHDWPQRTTPAGYGTQINANGLRTTDIVGTQDYLSHYAMYGLLGTDGVLPPGQDIISARRPGFPGGVNGGDPYYFENNYNGIIPSFSDTAFDLDPQQNGGLGSWTWSDNIVGGEWIDTGTKSGICFVGAVTTAHNWYRTTAAKEVNANGTPLIYDRNVDEAKWATTFGPSANADIFYTQVTPGTHVTVAYVDPGAINQSLSISVSSPHITVHLATNGSGAITTTANALLTLWNATGAATALASAVLYTSVYTNDGTGLLQAMSTELIAGGPAWCPHHNVDSGIIVTGPASSNNEAVLLIYDPADLIAVRDSGGSIPDYSPDPLEFVFLKDLTDASGIQLCLSGARQGQLSASYYEPISKKLYLLAPDVDLTFGSNNPLPIIHVFQVS